MSIARSLDAIVNQERVISVQATSQTLDDGDLVKVEDLIANNTNLYNAEQPDNIATNRLAIIVGDEVYQDANGNRIDITDPTQINYPAGFPVKAILPARNMRFEFTNDVVTTGSQANIAVGNVIIPTASDYEFTAAASAAGTEALILTIERLTNISTGLSNQSGFIARVTTAIN